MIISIILPCGCQFTDTAVLGMCGRHAQELDLKRRDQETKYSEFQRLMTQMGSSPRRGDEP